MTNKEYLEEAKEWQKHIRGLAGGKQQMKRCIECGEKTRNKRSYLCQKCFDKALEVKVESPHNSWF